MSALTVRQVATVDPPKLTLHVGGHWNCRIPARFGGGSKWFGPDEALALRKFKAWTGTEWQKLTFSHHGTTPRKEGRATEQRVKAVSHPMPKAGDHPRTIRAAADSLFAVVDAESGEHGRKKVRACLSRFLNSYGEKLAHELTPADLIQFKASLNGLTASSKNDLLVYSRRLLSHCWDIEAIQEPFRMKVLGNVKRGALPDKAMKPETVKALIEAIHSEHPVLARICLLQFYITGRPSEAPKAIWCEEFGGEWESEGVLATAGKSTRRTGEARKLLFSEPALKLLKAIGKPTWKRGDGMAQPLCPNGFAYGAFARRIGKRIEVQRITGKETLSVWGFRHASNQALLDAGVSEEDARKAAGHVRDRVRRAYGVRENYNQTRKALAILADLVPMQTVGL